MQMMKVEGTCSKLTVITKGRNVKTLINHAFYPVYWTWFVGEFLFSLDTSRGNIH